MGVGQKEGKGGRGWVGEGVWFRSLGGMAYGAGYGLGIYLWSQGKAGKGVASRAWRSGGRDPGLLWSGLVWSWKHLRGRYISFFYLLGFSFFFLCFALMVFFSFVLDTMYPTNVSPSMLESRNVYRFLGGGKGGGVGQQTSLCMTF